MDDSWLHEDCQNGGGTAYALRTRPSARLPQCPAVTRVPKQFACQHQAVELASPQALQILRPRLVPPRRSPRQQRAAQCPKRRSLLLTGLKRRHALQVPPAGAMLRPRCGLVAVPMPVPASLQVVQARNQRRFWLPVRSALGLGLWLHLGGHAAADRAGWAASLSRAPSLPMFHLFASCGFAFGAPRSRQPKTMTGTRPVLQLPVMAARDKRHLTARKQPTERTRLILPDARGRGRIGDRLLSGTDLCVLMDVCDPNSLQLPQCFCSPGALRVGALAQRVVDAAAAHDAAPECAPRFCNLYRRAHVLSDVTQSLPGGQIV